MVRPANRSLLAAAGFMAAVVLSACQSTTPTAPITPTTPISTTTTTPTTTTDPTTTVETTTATTTTTAKPKPVTHKTTTRTTKKTTTTCGSGYYRNSDGVCVHRPAPAPTAPAGATAQCRDGTYSYSKHRSGTCSHHGGVAVWL